MPHSDVDTARTARLSAAVAADPRPLHSLPTRRSSDLAIERATPHIGGGVDARGVKVALDVRVADLAQPRRQPASGIEACATQDRSEEHTSELQSRENLVCRLLLERNNWLAVQGQTSNC